MYTSINVEKYVGANLDASDNAITGIKWTLIKAALNPNNLLNRRPIAWLIGGSGGKSDEKSGQWDNLRRGEIIGRDRR